MRVSGASRISSGLMWGLLTVALIAPGAMPDAELPAWPICIFRWATGWPCPACGLTHAAIAAGRFHWALSARHHPLGPAVLLGAVALWAAAGRSWLSGRPLPRLRPWHAALAGWTLLATWILRLASGWSGPAP